MKLKISNQRLPLKFSSLQIIDNYDKGYQAGYDQGYADGFAEGETKGKADGYNQGYDVGLADGENQGYTKGYEAGYADGYVKGKEDGYAEGHSAGFSEGETVGYNNGYTEGKAEGIEEGYKDGFADGEASVDNNLVYAQTARFGNLNLFGKADVVIDMPYLQSASLMFRPDTTIWGSSACLNRMVEHITFNSDSENMTSATQMFYFAEPWDAQTALKRITLNMDMSRATSVQYMFNGCSLLETVDGTPLDFSSVVDSNVTLANAAPKLAYIRFAPNTIKVNLTMALNYALTKESIQSIFEGLNNTVSGKTLTVSKTAINNAFGSSESAEWLELVATKSNWTISLS